MFLSCQKDDSEISASLEKMINRKLYFEFIEDKEPIWVSEYHYNNEAKLDTIYYYSGQNLEKAYQFELFRYNSVNEIVNKLTFHYANDSIGWLLHDSTYYGYENGKLILEETLFFTLSSDHILLKYEYENSKLIRKYNCSEQQLLSCWTYDYSGDLCVKESMFLDGLCENLYDYTIHIYEDGLLMKSEKYKSNDALKQIIIYTYDEKGNLIIEESKKIDFSLTRPLDYVYRYEYY